MPDSLLGNSESRWKVGDRVRHRMSGWAGEVIEVRPDDSGMRGSQGPLVTVRPDHPRPAFARPGWQGWKPITVTDAELEVQHG